MTRHALATVAVLLAAAGCGPTGSPDRAWAEAAAAWAKPGATAEERLRDYRECHRAGVEASTSRDAFGPGRRFADRFGRRTAADFGGRMARRASVPDECMAARGGTRAAGPAPDSAPLPNGGQ